MRWFVLYIAICCLWSCKKSEDFGPQYNTVETAVSTQKTKTVLVLNEGNFGFGNASLSAINKETDKVNNNVFKANNNHNLGDVLQSGIIIDSTAYLLVNNSNAIEIVNLKNFKSLKRVSIDGSPRYAIKYKEGILISTMGGKGIFYLNHQTQQIEFWSGSNGWLEEMVISNNRLFACNRTTHKVDVYDLNSRQKIKSIAVGQDPESINLVDSTKLCVLSTGGWDRNDRSLASIYSINPYNFRANRLYQFSNIENSPTRLRYHAGNKKLYFINQGLYQINIELNSKPLLVLGQQSGELLYGLSIENQIGNLYLTNAKNYVDNGTVTVLNPTHENLNSHKVGVLPNQVLFY